MKLNRDVLRNLPLALRIEIEENAQRKALTQSELAAEQKRILFELRKHKAPGKRTDLDGGKATSVKAFTEVRATALVGKLFGESHMQVEKRAAIVAAAEAEPEKFSKLLAKMDRTGRVNGVYRLLKIAKQAEQIRDEPPPLPERGPYRVGVGDPPWPYESRSGDPSKLGMIPYPAMSIAQICALPVASIMHADSILWLWTTNAFMRHAYTVLDAWGFAERTILTWNKSRSGTGDWLLGQTEHCIFATRGEPIVTLTNQSTRLDAPRPRGHSVKPPEFYNLVESLCPAPRYADLFSRYRHNDKWDCHGDEAPQPQARGFAPK
jgi:N6-adenosine-specific RNA methylase IME4